MVLERKLLLCATGIHNLTGRTFPDGHCPMEKRALCRHERPLVRIRKQSSKTPCYVILAQPDRRRYQPCRTKTNGAETTISYWLPEQSIMLNCCHSVNKLTQHQLSLRFHSFFLIRNCQSRLFLTFLLDKLTLFWPLLPVTYVTSQVSGFIHEKTLYML